MAADPAVLGAHSKLFSDESALAVHATPIWLGRLAPLGSAKLELYLL
jgi:hypothetical protein